MRALSQLGVVVAKETRDNLRDRRALTTALIMPLIGPLTLVAVFFAFQQAEVKTKSPHVPIIDAQNAPELVHFLAAQGVVVEPDPIASSTKQAASSANTAHETDAANDAAADLVRSAKADVVLRIPKDFGDHLREGSPAVVEVICDPSRQNAVPTLARVEQLVDAYSREIGSLRLLVRGVDPALLQAVKAERVDVGAPGAEKAILLGSMPLFLLLACFMSGIYVSIDITAGERERGSLEPLLLNPLTTTTIVLGKLIAAIAFTGIGVGLSLATLAVLLPSLPFADIGIDAHVDAKTFALYALLFVPTTILAASLQIFVGTLSKNTKTAQASLGLLMLVPMTPGIVVSLFPQQPSAFTCAIPALGEAILSQRLLRGESIALVHWLANSASDLAIAAILVVVTARLFGARMLSS
jgi:sodium transport system permease protein